MDRPTGSSSWDDPIQSKSQAHDDETTAIMDRLGPDGDQLHRKEELVIEPTPIGTTKAHHIQHRPASTFSHSSSFIEETKNNISSRHLSLDSFSTQQHRRSSFSSSSSSLGSDKNNSMILWSDEKDPQDGTSKPKHSHWQADDGVNIKMSGDTYNKESITAEQQKFSASTSSSSSLLFSRERIHAPTVGGPSDAMAQPSGAFVTLTGISPQIQVDLTLPFPIKLHVMLSHPQFENCIEWLPHGRSWRIVDGAKFETDVIHKFFRSGKLTSFMRQVRSVRIFGVVWFLYYIYLLVSFLSSSSDRLLSFIFLDPISSTNLFIALLHSSPRRLTAGHLYESSTVQAPTRIGTPCSSVDYHALLTR